ncbi:MAG: hypothetical protein GY714_20280 [Desulfobacterales bacterium]|nr:hypothetical protein [Desulfobacterales bacterium]
MLVSEILDAAARKLGVIASGESLNSDEQPDALESLQVMLRSWAAEKLNVFSSVHEDHTLVGGTYEYTWGSGGDINTARPHQVTGVSILDSSGVTHKVDTISEGKYRSLALKTTTGRPYYLFPLYGYPLVTISLHPIPVNAETLKLESLKPFTETSSFGTVNDTLQMPVSYEEPIIYNLAVRIAPEFGKSVSREVAAVASNSYDRITNRNASNQVEPVGITLPVNNYNRYSVNSDYFR